MGKKLAIKGHPTRGKEVIELLEMMSGENIYRCIGEMESLYYFIDNDNIIYGSSLFNDNYVFFTLEEFWKKYPFKVGDKVVYTKFGDNCDDYPLIIKSMKWTGTTIEYAFDGYVTCLAKDLKMWNGEPDAAISGIYLNSCDYADEVELNLGDYEIEVRDGKTYAVKKKPKYPTTYEECCEKLGIEEDLWFVYEDIDGNHINSACISNYRSRGLELYHNLEKLKICRDAYWKVAGEQMGLGKPWEPDWKNGTETKYTIVYSCSMILNGTTNLENKILAFPTKEMRDAFYENFKDLIEQCKELL